MKRLLQLGLFLIPLLTGLQAVAAENLLFSVNTDNTEEVNAFETQDVYQELANYLGIASGTSIKLVVGQNATTELQRTRTGYYALLLAPAHVIGSALKYGYEPVAEFPGTQKAVFVSLKTANIQKIEQAKGKRLMLPNQDSLATYLAKGELNAMGIQMKSFFSNVRYSRYQDSALFSLGIGQSDIVAVDEVVAKRWLGKNPGAVVMETQAVPNLSVAINNKVPKPVQEKIRAALLNLKLSKSASLLHRLKIAGFEPAKREDFQYVSTLGYFTPKVLPGATVINAGEAKKLLEQGVVIYDTRVEHEYQESHIKGAISLPYKENSSKEVDFDSSVDAWDLSKLPKDKSTSIILSCNGPECWKSYKSAKQAVEAKFSKVYWFRGGYPEWKEKGYPVE